MEGQKKRDRKANFTDEEVRCLLEGIGQEKETINCQLQGTLTVRRKKEAWERVRLRVNAVSKGAERSMEEIKRKWKYLKAAVLKEQSYQKKTGGGGPIKETAFKELILYILGDRSDAVFGIAVLGTDSFVANTAPETLIRNMDEDSSQLNPMATTSDNHHPSSSSLAVDDLQQPENLLLVSPQLESNTNKSCSLPAGTPSTSSQFQRKRRRHQLTSTSSEDELLNAWLSSEITANSVRADVAKARVEVAHQKMKVLKLQERKLLMEIGNLEPRIG